MLQTFQYQNSPITFNLDGDCWMNATEMAKAFGKQPKDYLKTSSTQEFLSALKAAITQKDNRPTELNDLVRVYNGGATPGTWMQEDVALDFAQWLSPAFKVWCNFKIKELISTGKTELAPKSKEETIMQAMKYLQADVESLQEQNKLLETTIKEQAPVMEYAGKVLNAVNLIASTVVAADFGKSADWLHKTLKGKHIMWKVNGVWVLTTKYSGYGYTQSKTFPYTDSLGNSRTSIKTYWTEKGRAFLHEILKEFLTEKAA